MCKDSPLDEDSIGSNCWGSSFFFSNVLALDATICTYMSFNFAGAFVREDYKGGKCIAPILTGESCRIPRPKTLECMELSQFFSYCRVATFGLF